MRIVFTALLLAALGYAGPPVARGGELPATLGLEFVSIPGGEFEMGSDEGDADEKPVHRVWVDGFSMGKSEVTRAQWLKVMGNDPSKFGACDDCPVEQVSWNDVQEFLRELSAMTGEEFRLPTEAEWEYAAGGGSRHQKWAGADTAAELGRLAWYDANAANKTHPVCTKETNPLGLCDMSGNVWEWCSDWYEGYPGKHQENPAGPSTGSLRVIRGGSWRNDPRGARSVERSKLDPGYRNDYIGFRLVMP